MIVKKILLFIILIMSNLLQAQDSLTLNANQVLAIVRSFHPVLKQADIGIEIANANLLTARGAFDPLARTYVARKRFDNTLYYNYASPEIEIPTWYGVELFAGLETLSGGRTDNNETIGQTSYLGISVPLAKDLLLDKRRAALRQAKIYQDLASIEQRAIANDLLMQTMDAYWQWVRAHQTFQIIKDAVLLNQKRFEFVKKSYVLGERPAIDTLEALAQLQSFEYQQNSYQLAFQNATLALSAYLWTGNDTPYQLPEIIQPTTDWRDISNIENVNFVLMDLLNITAQNHPALQLYDAKLKILEVEKRLKFQDLLPKIDFRYNHLGKNYNLLQTATRGAFLENNYQYGIKFEMPLFLSQGRGDYQKAKLKIAETQYQQSQKTLELQVKVKSYYNEWTNLQQQLTLQTRNVANYQSLVRAEEIRLLNGESSLFLINSRENKALEAREKLIELQTKYCKTVYALQWSAGLLR